MSMRRALAVCAAIATALFAAVLPAAAVPSNDEAGAPTDVFLDETFVVFNGTATESLDDPACESSRIFKTVWFTYRATSTGPLVARLTPGRDVDGELAVMSVSEEVPSLIACEDLTWEGEAENVRFAATAGTRYLFMAGNAGPDQAGGRLALNVHRPVSIRVRLDGVAWTKTPQGYAVVTGTARCSRTARIPITSSLGQGSGNDAIRGEGSRYLNCSPNEFKPWQMQVTPFVGDGYKRGRATLGFTAEHPADEVTLTRSLRVTITACTRIGTPWADSLNGTPGRDRLCGLHGHDTLRGAGGNDVLIGHDGSDDLFGGRGRDVLLGGTGRDSLDGGTGRDLCRGGRGVDRRSECERF